MVADGIAWRGGKGEKLVLLNVARRALTLSVMQGASRNDWPAAAVLARPGGAFVTLRRRGRLRGCIGQIAPDLSLVQLVAHCAVAAGREDPRFPPVNEDDLAEIDIEISVLSPAAEILPDQIEIGRHGLIVSDDKHRGVLLPQVAPQYHWTPERFLQETCVKAGLDQNAWKIPGTRIEAFTADIFSESGICPGAGE